MVASSLGMLVSWVMLAVVRPHGPGGDTLIMSPVVLALAIQVIILIKRAHDLGISAYLVSLAAMVELFVAAQLMHNQFGWVWLHFVVAIAGFYVLFWPGQREAKAYGDPPTFAGCLKYKGRAS